MEQRIQKIKEEGKKLEKEVKQRTVGYILAALGFVAGLAWNDAVKGLIDYVFPLSKDSLLAKFTYAAVLTVLLVAVTIYLLRWVGEKDETGQ